MVETVCIATIGIVTKNMRGFALPCFSYFQKKKVLHLLFLRF